MYVLELVLEHDVTSGPSLTPTILHFGDVKLAEEDQKK